MLLEMKNDPLLELYWRKFYEPILQYDGENKLDLVRVLELLSYLAVITPPCAKVIHPRDHGTVSDE